MWKIFLMIVILLKFILWLSIIAWSIYIFSIDEFRINPFICYGLFLWSWLIILSYLEFKNWTYKYWMINSIWILFMLFWILIPIIGGLSHNAGNNNESILIFIFAQLCGLYTISLNFHKLFSKFEPIIALAGFYWIILILDSFFWF